MKNNTTGLKLPTGQPLILLSCPSGSRCCIWYGELQIVLLYHLNVISAVHGEQLPSCTLAGKRQESVFHFFRKKKYYSVDRFFLLWGLLVSSFFSSSFCHHHVAFPWFHRRPWERGQHDVPDLGSFLTSAIVSFNIVVGKSAGTCQEMEPDWFFIPS